jgi:hypothetical protein
MDACVPKAGIVEIVLRRVAEQRLDILSLMKVGAKSSGALKL